MSTDALFDSATVAIPSGATLTVDGRRLSVRGPLGVVRRPFPADVLHLTIDGPTATLKLGLPANRKRAQALLHTWGPT